MIDGPILGANPLQIPTLYEKVVAGGLLSPGVAKVSGFSRSWDWDVKKAKGASGASTTLQGEGLAKGSIEFLLWRPEHFLEWETFAEALVRGQKQKKIEALSVLHPDLQRLEIFSLVVEEIGGLVDKGKGLYSIAVKFLEYRPPKPAGGSPSGAKASGGWKSKTASTAQSEQDKELEKLIAEAQAA
jgi:hypothetical protein